MKRLAATPMERIDRERDIAFSYRGKSLRGLAGDTVATALFANGVRIFSRSLKYHRPRGLYNLDGHGSQCLMRVNGEPNVRACARPLEEGMEVLPQNVIGSPECDLLSALQWFHGAMPAGFYYRRFHRPAWIWPLAQKILRWSAGIGRLDPAMSDGLYQSQYLNCELCVIGGGLAGMTAALTAARAGVRVVLLERKDHLGGSLDYRRVPLHNRIPAYLYARQRAEEVLAAENIRVLLSAAATGMYQSNQVTAVQKGGPSDRFRYRYLEIRAKGVVVATGAIERPLVFENNDAPGVMQGSCAQQLLHHFALRPGCLAVVCGCHDGLLEVAADLAEAGVRVLAVTDIRQEGFDPEAVARLHRLAVPFLAGYRPAAARQRSTLKGVELRSVDGGKSLSLPCDVLVASAGETPLSQLLHVAGAPVVYDAPTGRFLPGRPPEGVHGAGRVSGLDDERSVEAEGRLAGLSGLRDAGVEVGSELASARNELAGLPRPKTGCGTWIGKGPGYWRFVSFDEDVTVGQVEEALEDGFDGPELVKRYTAAGTGPSQSTFSGQNLAALVAEKKGLAPGSVLPTTLRPPVEPTSLAVLGGRRRHPVKRTPLHERQAALGAVFRLAGEWERAAHFGSPQAREEVLNVRSNVGFI
ncbi:MAG: (2Fe-2S)-binding protein, partial [Deltaproteobacteria bacterium]|nr:(2Fe-2S)-binding protein [Deltaproteobacteria bacterium]